MTTLFIAGARDNDETYEAACDQLLKAGYSLAGDPVFADGIVTMPGTPARTVRGWLTQADHDRHMGYVTGTNNQETK